MTVVRHYYRKIVPVIAVLLLFSGISIFAQDSGSLTELARGKTDKADTHGFTDMYDLLFAPMRLKARKVCEIGIAWGGSLQVWSQYFSNAIIYGIDFYTLDQLRALAKSEGVEKIYIPETVETPRIKTFVADQSKRNQLSGFIKKYGSDFDLILDDGGHTMEQQQVSFGYLFRHVKPGGFYVIEDVHTSLPNRYPGFSVQKNEENTTLGMIHHFIRHEKIKSQYLTPEEVEYLNKNIEYCSFFISNNQAHSMSCIFKKRR
ncbi:MAG: class I SAM-dependent methyltransferase [Acidobacteria bacterium]|nr:class I SAM-dependent methyltransferase [Acidobacteriota bacterium]